MEVVALSAEDIFNYHGTYFGVVDVIEGALFCDQRLHSEGLLWYCISYAEVSDHSS